MDRKREEVFARLEARSRERKERATARREKTLENADPKESVDAFWKAHNTMKKDIMSRLKDVINEFASETRRQRRERIKGDPSEDPATRAFAAVSTSIRTFQENVTSASYFLPKYDIRSAQNDVNEAESALDDAKQKIRPPKKFSFKGVSRRKHRGQSALDAAKTIQKTTSETTSTDAEGIPDASNHIASLKDGYHETEGFVFANKRGVALRIPDVADKTDSAPTFFPNKGGDVTLGNLTDSVVAVCTRLGSMRVVNLKNCDVYCGPIDGSVFVNGCTGCRFVLASRQVRIHRSNDCTFEVQTNSGPIIEDCDKLRFGPYPNLRYEGSDEDFRESTLDDSSCWRDVKDFKWHRSHASPHWSVLKTEDRRRTLKKATEMKLSFLDDVTS